MPEVTEEAEASQRVEDILRYCLFKHSEIIMAEGELPDDAVMVEGVVTMYGFHPERLEEKREDVVELIEELVFDEFLVGEGGGQSFLNLCKNREGEQWTSFHKVMEALLLLAMGLDLAGYCAPPEMWDAFPGGMPYVWFRTTTDQEVGTIPLGPAAEGIN